MQALDPIAVAVGNTDVYVDLSGSTQPYKAVILYNASPLVIGVTSGPQSVYLQPNSTIVVPASASTGKVLMNVVGSTSSTTTGDVYPTIVWLADSIPTALSSAPVTEVTIGGTPTVNVSGPVDANITNASIPVTGSLDATITNAAVPVSGSVDATIQNASLTVAGSVDIGTIAAGQVIEVINSPGAYIGTESQATPVSATLTPASGGGTATDTVTIPTSPVMHAALVSGVYTITAASNQPVQIQVKGNNTNTLYYNFDNLTTNVTNQAIPEAVLAISAADTALVVSHVSGGGTQSSTINLNFYSQAIPPDPYVAALITQGLFGTTAETVINPLVSPPLLQSIYNNQVSTNWGIKVADSLAPADTAQSGITALTAGANTTLATLPGGIILRRVSYQPQASLTGTNSLGLAGGNPLTANYDNGTAEVVWQPPTGRYIPSSIALTLYSSTAVTVVWQYEYTTL